jgi:hypothetical protein
MNLIFSRQRALFSTNRGTLALALFTLFSVGVVGCGSYGGARGSRLDSKINPITARSPLTTQTTSAARLAGVNSVELAIPSIQSSSSVGVLGPVEARDIIERAARETMTLKISVASDRVGSATSTGARRFVTTDSDAVLNTEILRFEERQGSAIGGEPAVVSFRMTLRDRVGAELWSASYFLKQEALSENLLRIKERVGPDGLGAGWRSAHYVFQRGVESALKDLNTQRERQFLSGR